MDLNELLTVEQVAGELQVSLETVRRKVKAGKLPHIRMDGNVIRIRRTDLNTYLGIESGNNNHSAIQILQEEIETIKTTEELEALKQGMTVEGYAKAKKQLDIDLRALEQRKEELDNDLTNLEGLRSSITEAKKGLDKRQRAIKSRENEIAQDKETTERELAKQIGSTYQLKEAKKEAQELAYNARFSQVEATKLFESLGMSKQQVDSFVDMGRLKRFIYLIFTAGKDG